MDKFIFHFFDRGMASNANGVAERAGNPFPKGLFAIAFMPAVLPGRLRTDCRPLPFGRVPIRS
jgi:hypothetical protein